MSQQTPSLETSAGRDERPRFAIVLGLLAAGLAVAAIAVLSRRAANTSPAVANAPAADTPAAAPQRAGRGMSSSDAKSELERARELRRALGVEPSEPAPEKPPASGDGD